MRFTKYAENIRLDGRLFIFILLVINIYRLVFMLLMQSYMGEGADGEIGAALWAGLRLSLKTAGGVALLSFVVATLPNIVRPQWNTRKNRWLIGVTAILLLSVLFEGRFPYYRQFGMTYHLQVIQGLNDDMSAIFWTMAEEYGLVWRLVIACIITVGWGWLLRKWLDVRLSLLPAWLVPPTGSALPKKFGAALMWLTITFVTALFIRFGGSFTYGGGINWENAGITGDNFLNECILDDVQALYRAKENAQRMEEGHISGVDTDRIREFARELADDPTIQSDNLAAYLTHRTQGAKLPRPQHIFIILGESWANWPIMEQYANLKVAEGIKSLSREDNAFFTDRFMPNGDFTSIAITGLITGLSEVVTRVNYQPQSFTAPYPTAMAPQFKRLGYQVDFWYGGVPSWDNINRLALAQGFDHFYGYMDYNAPKITTWGTADGYMYDALLKHLADEPPTVHLIMTVSNHPPYTLDLNSMGFDIKRETELARALGKVDDPAELATELGHYWYMDKVTTEFVRKVSEQYPDTLFVITGDHAVRMNPGTTPTMFEQQGIPFLLYGAGVHKNILPPNTVGGHTYIVPTILELIAPQNFTYVSVAPSMTKEPTAAFNRDFWLTASAMGGVDNDKIEALPGSDILDKEAETGKAHRLIYPMRTLSWWLLHKGTDLPSLP